MELSSRNVLLEDTRFHVVWMWLERMLLPHHNIHIVCQYVAELSLCLLANGEFWASPPAPDYHDRDSFLIFTDESQTVKAGTVSTQ